MTASAGPGAPGVALLVPHDPDEDPRIRWVADLCRELAPTEVLSISWSREAIATEHEDGLYFERGYISALASMTTRAASAFGATLDQLAVTLAYTEAASAGVRAHSLRERIGSVTRFVGKWAHFAPVMDVLYHRARARPARPSVVVCHDFGALAPALLLKRQLGIPVIYDAHEYWPDADPLSAPWEVRTVRAVERTLIRRCDSVVTVSPQLARHMERVYGLRAVITAPNAPPLDPHIEPSGCVEAEGPVRVLLQGRVVPGRGIGALLDAWRSVPTGVARLLVRAPESPYLADLRLRHQDLVARGSLKFAAAVGSDQLIAAATGADIGVVPYGGESINHRYACPNKLGEYMQAGLAILTNRIEFVAQTVQRYDCGAVYDASDPRSLIEAVCRLSADRDALRVLKANARRAAVSDYNWSQQSTAYRDAVAHYLTPRVVTSH